MLKGINLTLMMGPMVPVSVPKSVLDALTEVTVTINDVGQSGFQLTFKISTRSPLHTLFLLSGGGSIPLLRVIIIVTINGTPDVIMDGMVTHHQISPGDETGYSTLTLMGKDVSVLMDKIDFSGFPYPAVPAEGRVALLLAKYAFLGIIPLIIPSVLIDVVLPTAAIARQKGTDLKYINDLAERVGYVFYLDPGPVAGTNIAYWGPQIKVGVPQPALNINMDMHTNVESLSFNFDNDKNGIPTVYIYNETTKISLLIPLPPITPLNPPLGLIPPIPTHFEPVNDELSKLPVAQAIMRGLASASKMADAVTGKGSLDVLRYGRPLKARQLVGVRGAGMAFDGLHYVKSVTHTIKPGEYKQSFELSRNGLISTVPRVIP